MTAEYLDRSSLVARMKYYEKHTTEESGEHYAYSVALREIRNAPAADVVEVVHAKWIPFHSEAAGDIQYCSACDIGFDARMDYCPLVQMVRNTDEVEIALNIFKNVMKEDYARVLRCKDCKYGSYDSKPNGAMICLRTNDGFWRKETDFCSYGERREE